jgi:UDP-2,4-diacetamido-2,4,6-trideoxy-beta-L-altropyranose hydrolase
MRVAFRVDASRRIGTGHAMRCLTLAETLRSRGAECVFVHRNHAGAVGDLMRNRGFDVRLLPAPESGQPELALSGESETWLGVPLEKDVEDTQKALNNDQVGWLFVDHYSLDASWESRMRSSVARIAVIDDLADRPHDCDLLIDQSAVPNPVGRYDGLVPEHALRLCGPEYALIGEPFSRARSLVGPRRGPLSRVLVYYGGSDPGNETLRTLRVLSNSRFAGIAVDVVVGPNHPDPASVREIAATRPLTSFHEPQSDLVRLMLEADCFLGAGGTTTWERCSLGLPSIVTTLADNQIPLTQELHNRGALIWAGDRSNISDECLQAAMHQLIQPPGCLQEIACQAWSVTDALGRLRVADAVLPSSSEPSDQR